MSERILSGASKPISSVPLIFRFFNFDYTTGYILNIVYIFVRCRRSSAAVTPDKFEPDLRYLSPLIF